MTTGESTVVFITGVGRGEQSCPESERRPNQALSDEYPNITSMISGSKDGKTKGKG
jgi:hypothetical protein